MSEAPISTIAEINPPLPRFVADDEIVSLVRMPDVRETGGLTGYTEARFGEVKAGFTRFAEGDVLFAKITPCMENGKGAHAHGLLNGIGCGSTEFHVLRAKDGNDGAFIFQVTQSKAFRQKAETAMSGSAGQQRVQADFFRNHLVYIPAPTQQRRIAEILGTVDEAIEATEALIAKQQQVKAGLMHDLFTRGLTPDGNLRPPPTAAPALYHQTPLGLLPKEWSWAKIGELLAKTFSPMRSGPFGSALLKDELVENGIPLLGIDNVFIERFEPTFRRFVSQAKFAQLIRYSVFSGDVIITIMGTVGRCCVVPDLPHQALSSKHLWTMTFDREKVIPELVCWQLNHAVWVKRWFARHSQGAVMEAIQSSTLRELTLPLPPIQEQERMAERYTGTNAALAAEAARLAKLRQQKQGLMQALLTPPGASAV